MLSLDHGVLRPELCEGPLGPGAWGTGEPGETGVCVVGMREVISLGNRLDSLGNIAVECGFCTHGLAPVIRYLFPRFHW